MPSVSVIVPIFNGIRFLPAFFESLSAAIPPNTEVIMVDDSSTEAVFETVPEMPRASRIVRLRNDQNLGYSTTVNRGFGVAEGDVVIQVNTDLVLDAHCLTALIDLISREDNVGIVGSRLIYPDTGRLQHIAMAFGEFSKLRVYADMPADHPLCGRTREVQIMNGSTVAMTRQVLDRIGPLEENYFNHNEDLEHCLLARKHGYRNFVNAESVAYHWKSLSGPARFARQDSSDGLFWSRWGGAYEVDLDRFFDESLDHILDVLPELEQVPFELIDLSRGADQRIALSRLEQRWPGIGRRRRAYRQMNHPADHLRLALTLPHWVATEPVPFIYLVDRHRELANNTLWFQRRQRVFPDELIVDLAGSVLSATELDG